MIWQMISDLNKRCVPIYGPFQEIMIECRYQIGKLTLSSENLAKSKHIFNGHK